MPDRRLLTEAIAGLGGNPEQEAAVSEHGHCVVLAGPGSGKTKTLTIAMARALLDDVAEPRGIACITYNNECSIELETRLAQLGIASSERIFIGTVHSFALTQIILPYARCVIPGFPSQFRISTLEQARAAVEVAHGKVIGGRENPHERWKFASAKRRRDVDRSLPAWKGQNPELAAFVEAYEAELRRHNLIDFDDMPLLALKMVREHPWIRRALLAKFPVLFVDEYQDLGHALHELVLLLCFNAGIRLFAVGDPDQSIYGFLGANPGLLQALSDRLDVRSIRLRFNYRCGRSIIRASMAALGEDRDYTGPDGAPEGTIDFYPIDGELDAQANVVFEQLIPAMIEAGTAPDKIAVLYRWAQHGEKLGEAAKAHNVPIVRADADALVKRGSRLSRLLEASAAWVSGGWKEANPPFRRLAADAVAIVLGSGGNEEERNLVQLELMKFLHSTIDTDMSTHQWLSAFKRDLVQQWRRRSRNVDEEWSIIDLMIQKTDPARKQDADLPLSHFGGRIEGSGRVNLSTFHSAKGREFDAVVMYGVNNDVIPNRYDVRDEVQLREARRQFYVGVTRAKNGLHLVFRRGQSSIFVRELYLRITPQPNT